MEVTEFHKKMKQHCDSLNGDCQKCCFLEYCYSQKRDIHDDFLSDVISRLSVKQGDGTDISDQVIRNRHNVVQIAESNSQR